MRGVESHAPRVAPHFAEVVIHFVTDLRNNPDVMLTARRLIA
jgi:hypothetical protein